MAGKKKRKTGLFKFALLICLLILSVFIGKRFAEYTWDNNRDSVVNKNPKPVGDEQSPVDEADGDGDDAYVMPDRDIITITALTMEFFAAEHLKKADKLSLLTAPDYYSTLLKRVNQLKSTDAVIKDLDYKEISRDSITVEIKYTASSNEYTETVFLRFMDGTWKIVKVES